MGATATGGRRRGPVRLLLLLVLLASVVTVATSSVEEFDSWSVDLPVIELGGADVAAEVPIEISTTEAGGRWGREVTVSFEDGADGQLLAELVDGAGDVVAAGASFRTGWSVGWGDWCSEGCDSGVRLRLRRLDGGDHPLRVQGTVAVTATADVESELPTLALALGETVHRSAADLEAGAPFVRAPVLATPDGGRHAAQRVTIGGVDCDPDAIRPLLVALPSRRVDDGDVVVVHADHWQVVPMGRGIPVDGPCADGAAELWVVVDVPAHHRPPVEVVWGLVPTPEQVGSIEFHEAAETTSLTEVLPVAVGGRELPGVALADGGPALHLALAVDEDGERVPGDPYDWVYVSSDHALGPISAGGTSYLEPCAPPECPAEIELEMGLVESAEDEPSTDGLRARVLVVSLVAP